MRHQRFTLVLSERESLALVRLAELEGGLSKAALVRRLVRQEAALGGLWRVRNVDSDPIKEKRHAE